MLRFLPFRWQMWLTVQAIRHLPTWSAARFIYYGTAVRPY